MKKLAAGKRSFKFPDGDLVGSLHSSSSYNGITIFSPGHVFTVRHIVAVLTEDCSSLQFCPFSSSPMLPKRKKHASLNSQNPYIILPLIMIQPC